MDFRAPHRRSPDLARVYPLAGVVMLAAVLLVLLDLLYVALRSVGGPDQACSALQGAGGFPVEQVVGHRSWWPPSVVCEQMTGSMVLQSLTPGSHTAFWVAVLVFTAGFLAVAGTCLGPVGGTPETADDIRWR